MGLLLRGTVCGPRVAAAVLGHFFELAVPDEIQRKVDGLRPSSRGMNSGRGTSARARLRDTLRDTLALGRRPGRGPLDRDPLHHRVFVRWAVKDSNLRPWD